MRAPEKREALDNYYDESVDEQGLLLTALGLMLAVPITGIVFLLPAKRRKAFVKWFIRFIGYVWDFRN